LLKISAAAVTAAGALLIGGATTAAAGPATAGAGDDRVQLVEVETPDRAAKQRLQALGLDLTEHGDADSLDVVLHGADDARRLRGAGFRYRVRVKDLRAQARRHREADRRFRKRHPKGSDLPSGSTGYRTLAGFEQEMRRLAQRYPSLVRPLTLPYPTHEGRLIQGIEITRRAHDLDDGKPIFLNMGAHHAREWPSAEHSLEFAYDLLTRYGRDRRVTRLVDQTRTIVIPVVNPDGFHISRSADPGDPEDDFSLFDYEMKRKNCEPDPNGPCDDNPALGRLQGVDLNRNYGGLWGGPGAAVDEFPQDTYRGAAPFSEPETQNIRWLQSTRTITNLITNHTYSNLVLRPPGTIDQGTPVDEPIMRELGATMASRNNYANIPSYGLYDTTGATEDWTYWTAGSLGYTFEIGDVGFHPPYEIAVVGEYLGREPAAGAGRGGNQAAYFDMLEATADASKHSVIEGRAPAGHKLTLAKSFTTRTHDPRWLNNFGTQLGDPFEIGDSLRYELNPKGRFEWHVNPSTRPIVAGRLGRDPQAPPQPDEPLANPPGIPAENPYVASYEEGEYESIPFTVRGMPEVDNGRLTVHIEWSDANVDWDLYVLGPDGQVVSQSASFGDADEDAVLLDPPPGEYTAIVVNYDQAGRPEAEWDDWTGEVRFRSPDPTTEGITEAWTLTCERGGALKATRQVVVDRGGRVDVGDACRTPRTRAR
jgi:hypothetical protein